MTELEKKILEAQDAYYKESPIMSDEEFDALWNKLKVESPNSILLQKIGEDLQEGFVKEKHIINMNSLEKVNNEKDLLSWWKKRIKGKAIVQHKMDGISIELQYKEGELVRGVTRGNGCVGDDITSNVKKMKGFPMEVNLNEEFAVRGEIILEKDIFNSKYLPKGYANPRNMASGIAKQKEGGECKDLKIYFYDMKVKNNHENVIGKSECKKIEFLEKNNFNLAPTLFVSNPEEVFKIRNELVDLGREKLSYDIDGLVIKNDVFNELDLERNRPQYQIAFKFDTVSAATRIKDIFWSVSGRIITPVAILEPIELEGAIVRKASLSNPNRIRELKLRYDDLVLVSRRGQIIPYIERVMESNLGNEKIPSSLASYVDKDGVDWPVFNEGTRLIINDESFPQIRLHRIKKWIEKLDVKGFGDALLNKLFLENWINDISDLYMLDLKSYLDSTNLKKATTKAFDALYSKKEIPLSVFISGFDIEDIGERIVKLVVNQGYDNIKKIEEASIFDLSSIPGIGDFRAKKLKNGIQDMKSEMFKVLNFVQIQSKEKVMSDISGKSFCFTGALESMKRKDAQNLVEEKGGAVRSSVSKGLDYLVNNDAGSNSAKNKKAKELEVQVINEKQFMSMVK